MDQIVGIAQCGIVHDAHVIEMVTLLDESVRFLALPACQANYRQSIRRGSDRASAPRFVSSRVRWGVKTRITTSHNCASGRSGSRTPRSVQLARSASERPQRPSLPPTPESRRASPNPIGASPFSVGSGAISLLGQFSFRTGPPITHTLTQRSVESNICKAKNCWGFS